MASLLAAWITTYDSSGARFVKALLGDRDWHRAQEATYPLLALTLFLADASGGVNASPTAFAARPVAFAAAGPCTAVTEFVQKAINAVASVLKVNTSGGGFLGFLGKIWNTAVDLATEFVKGLIDVVTRPVVNLLVNVFGSWRRSPRPRPSSPNDARSRRQPPRRTGSASSRTRSPAPSG